MESAWEKIDQEAAQGKAVLNISKDIKTDLGGFYKKIDTSSNLTDEDHRRYGLLFFTVIE